MQNDTKLLIIANLITLKFEVDLYDVLGVKDTAYKILACHIAQVSTKFPDRVIAKFYRINFRYMNKRIDEMKVDYLMMDDEFKAHISGLINHAKSILLISERVNN